MNVYERLAAAATPRSTARPAARTMPAEKRRPSTTASRNRLPQAPVTPASRVRSQASPSKGRSQMQVLGKSRSQSNLRKIKSTNNEVRPDTAPVVSPSSSGVAPFIDAQIDRDAANITALARTIEDANYILIGTGAGFSADSGLAVYKDIARVPAYDLMGVDYATLCDPMWLQRNPEVFYGFWGYCFNSYRDTTPHEGYTIIKNMMAAYPNKRIYIYSSNVDSHFEKIGIPRQRFYEFHGTCMDWQCSRSCRIDSVYRLPFYYRFDVNKQTMRCSTGSISYTARTGSNTSPNNSTVSPHIPRPPPILSMFKKPNKNSSVFTQLYSSYYGDDTASDPHIHPQIASTSAVKDTSASETTQPSNSTALPVPTDTKRASPIVRKDVYDRVYSQCSRNSQTRGALHDALAKQGIDYLAIKSEAKRVCSLSSFSTVATMGHPVSVCQEHVRSANNIHNAPRSAEQQTRSLSAAESTAKETFVEEEPVQETKNTLPSPNVSSTNRNVGDHCTKHDPAHIEHAYRNTYESVRPIATQSNDGHPICPRCKYYLRPRVLMFDDAMFMELSEEEERYNSFKRQLFKNKSGRVCLLEIGCGLRIPTIRHEFDNILRRCAKSGIPCSLFRINPEGKRARTTSHMGPPQFYHIAQGGKDVMVQLANVLKIPY